MKEKSEFYTLTGYKLKQCNILTEAMEDYLEMVHRLATENVTITIKELAQRLNVQPPSVSKMCHKLSALEFLKFEKYGTITLTEKGLQTGSYLLWRHQLLETLLKQINQDDFSLEQVEKIEHFVDLTTLKNLEKFLHQRK